MSNKKKALLLLKAMTNPSRLDILLMIDEKDYKQEEIMKKLNVSQSQLSQSMTLFHQLDLVEKKKDGVLVYYSLTGSAKKLIAFLKKEFNLWEKLQTNNIEPVV